MRDRMRDIIREKTRRIETEKQQKRVTLLGLQQDKEQVSDAHVHGGMATGRRGQQHNNRLQEASEKTTNILA